MSHANTNWKTIKAAREQRADLLKQSKAIIDLAETEKRSLTDDEKGKFDALHIEAEQKRAQVEIYERQLDAEGALAQRSVADAIATGGNIPTPGDADSSTTTHDAATEKRHAREFEKWVRTGQDTQELRAITTAVPGGGYTVPTLVADKFVTMIRDSEAFRRAGATVITATVPGPYRLPVINDLSNNGATPGEGNDPGSADPVITFVDLQDYEFSSKTIPVTNQMLQISPVEPMVYNVATMRIAYAEQDAFTNGTGTNNKPVGLLASAEVGASGTLSYQSIQNTYHSVPQIYRNRENVCWMMSDNALSAVRNIKDDVGRPIYVNAAGPDMPDSLLGKPVVVNPAMPYPVAGSTPIAFGDFGSFYIKTVGTLNLLRDSTTLSHQNMTRFSGFANAGCGLADTNAIKTFQQTA